MIKKAQILTCLFMVPGSRHYRFPTDIHLIHLTAQVIRLNNSGRVFGEILT
jgi:hypothetical protein